MAPMSARLAAVAPDLVRRLHTCTADQLSSVVDVVVREAVAHCGLEDPVVSSVLDKVATGDPDAAKNMQAVVARLDEAAWSIQESEGDSMRYLTAFTRARAASAVLFAIDQETVAAMESIYEAQASLESVDSVRRLVEPLLPSD